MWFSMRYPMKIFLSQELIDTLCQHPTMCGNVCTGGVRPRLTTAYVDDFCVWSLCVFVEPWWRSIPRLWCVFPPHLYAFHTIPTFVARTHGSLVFIGVL